MKVLKRVISIVLAVIIISIFPVVSLAKTRVINKIDIIFDEDVGGVEYLDYYKYFRTDSADYDIRMYGGGGAKYETGKEYTVIFGVVATRNNVLADSADDIIVTVNGKEISDKTMWEIEDGGEKVPCIYVNYTFVATEHDNSFFKGVGKTISNIFYFLRNLIVSYFRDLF